MKTILASKVLSKALDIHHWTQADLAKKANLARSVVNWHLSRTRPIRDEHLTGYLTALGSLERPMLLAAWLRDMLSSDVIHDVFGSALRVQEEDSTTAVVQLREEVTKWSPQLDAEQRDMLVWWSYQLVRDPEIDEIFRGITRKAGWKPNA